MLANFHMCCIMWVLRAVFNILVRNANPRWPMCFRSLMFSLSGVVMFTLFYCLWELSCCACDVDIYYYILVFYVLIC